MPVPSQGHYGFYSFPVVQIKQLEGLIKNFYYKKSEAAKIRSRLKWAEEGEKSTRYC
jgi:hypothetical protein